jgi:hypothetical protein
MAKRWQVLDTEETEWVDCRIIGEQERFAQTV